MMATKTFKKTFKIGEYAVGGIIKVTAIPNKITVSVIDWSTKKPLAGHTREFSINSRQEYLDMLNFLHDMTSSFWVDTIIDWIKSKEGFGRNSSFGKNAFFSW
jgi:hypothetical protein